MKNNIQEEADQKKRITMTHGETILFSRIRNLRFPFSENTLKNLACFKAPTEGKMFETRYLDPNNAKDYRFLVFLGQSGFQDIPIAYHLFVRFVEKNHEKFSPDGKISCLDAEMEDIKIMYAFYFADTIQDMIDILERSDLEKAFAFSQNLKNGDLITRLWKYHRIYGEIEELERDTDMTNSSFSGIGRVVSGILGRDTTQAYDDPKTRKCQQQALLNMHVFG